MAADPDPPFLPRPGASEPDPITQRLREVWARVTGQADAFAAPVMVFVAVAVVGIFAWSRLGTEPPPPLELALPTVDPAAVAVPTAAAEPPVPTSAVVHVAGAVALPGVYEVSAAARIGDAVELAGGPTADADLDRINLAAGVTDGQQINVPRIGQAITAPTGASGGIGGSDTAALIDINSADTSQLETLPGVGPSTAAAIIRHREQHGPFPSVAALDDVSGIGPARLEALRDLVTVGGVQ